MAQIFQPFELGDASMTRRYGGTGLGLAISTRLADLMGGWVRGASVPGEGATFTLEVPLRGALTRATPADPGRRRRSDHASDRAAAPRAPRPPRADGGERRRRRGRVAGRPRRRHLDGPGDAGARRRTGDPRNPARARRPPSVDHRAQRPRCRRPPGLVARRRDGRLPREASAHRPPRTSHSSSTGLIRQLPTPNRQLPRNDQLPTAKPGSLPAGRTGPWELALGSSLAVGGWKLGVIATSPVPRVQRRESRLTRARGRPRRRRAPSVPTSRWPASPLPGRRAAARRGTPP